MEAVNKALSTEKYTYNGQVLVSSKKVFIKSVSNSKMVPVANSSDLSTALNHKSKESDDRPQIELFYGDTLEGLQQLWYSQKHSLSHATEPAALVFSSDTNPGGSSKSTNQGTQEEALCRITTLRPSLLALEYHIHVPHVQALAQSMDGMAPRFTALCVGEGNGIFGKQNSGHFGPSCLART